MDEDEFYDVPEPSSSFAYASPQQAQNEAASGLVNSKPLTVDRTQSVPSDGESRNSVLGLDWSVSAHRHNVPSTSLVANSGEFWNPQASDVRISGRVGGPMSQYVGSNQEDNQAASLFRLQDAESQGVQSQYEVYAHAGQELHSHYQIYDEGQGGRDSRYERIDNVARVDKSTLPRGSRGELLVDKVNRKVLYIDGFCFRTQPSPIILAGLREHWSAKEQKRHKSHMSLLLRENQDKYSEQRWIKGTEHQQRGEVVLAAIAFHKAMAAAVSYDKVINTWENQQGPHLDEILNVLQALNLRDEELKVLWLSDKPSAVHYPRAQAGA